MRLVLAPNPKFNYTSHMSDTNNWTVRMYKAELQGMEQGLTKIKSYGLCTLSAEKLIAEKKKQILKASK